MRLFVRRSVLLAIGLLLSFDAAWLAAADAPVLKVVSVDGAEQALSAQTWAGLPRTSVKAIDHDGKEATFEGVAARDVLKLVNAPLGKDLRGKNLALFVVAEAADGYRVIYALTEFDADFSDRVILIADRRDGHALADKEGPLRFVVPGDKRQARWLRELVSVSVKRAP
jgi:hypothetical protein